MNSISDYFLLINPWPYDFAAFDLWAKPLGLLYLASLIRKSGYRVHLIDCTDRAHPRIKNRYFKSQHYGTGHYYSEEIPKPKALEWVPRRYKRYGIPREEIIKEFQTLPYKPVAILITSRMTYWYPGVIEMIWLCREHFQNTPVVLGGLLPYPHPRSRARQFRRRYYFHRGYVSESERYFYRTFTSRTIGRFVK